MAELRPRPSCRLALPVCLCLFLLAAAPPLALARAAPAADSIHKLLRSHGLPGGLLPRSVESYTLDEGNGLLEARLSAPCYATYDNGDLAFFDTVVRGNLSFGALRGCEGLAQEELFMWLPVKGILVSDPGSGVILFDIGYAHKRLSRSLFEEPPDCKPSASTSMGAVEAARWRDSPAAGVPGLRERIEAEGEEGHLDQR
ncbi:unnamed protein product [Triticum aestivum]|uniref:DUF538 domain-containing protein n=2 Tax=Triticum aestivum TaxID=4565 RepID=A0A9R1JFB1_WHEAT|nr:uncharacterized protein LOC123052462 isoform X1 [Triticum aestivum]KAF7015370.1 hypothetical protein CFC21_029231 [Triticum aestivum]SPT17423.1 unnamed protein product [Triticum aestivum]